MKILLPGFIAGVLLSGLFALNAQAAPQALALLSTQGAVQLACSGGECAATFSSYCLQNERPSPPSGTAYELADTTNFRVTALDRHGQVVSLDAIGVLKITAARTQVAVRISVAKTELARLGLRRVSVDVGAGVTLLPVPQAGDKDPFSEAEIAFAKGTLRQAGSSIIGADEGRTATVRWLSGLLNALPDAGANEPRARQDLMRTAAARLARAELSAEARNLAQAALTSCGKDLELWIYPSLRRCLETAHDVHLWNLNAVYWQTIQTGS